MLGQGGLTSVRFHQVLDTLLRGEENSGNSPSSGGIHHLGRVYGLLPASAPHMGEPARLVCRCSCHHGASALSEQGYFQRMLSRHLQFAGLCTAETCLGIAVGGHVKRLGKGDGAVDLAQAAAEVLLEALQVQRQHLWGPAHPQQPIKLAEWREAF